MYAISANRITPSRCIALLTAFELLRTSPLYAADHPCAPGGTSLECRLTGVLHWLDAVAWVLAIILIVVIALAVHLYRKNRAAVAGRR